MKGWKLIFKTSEATPRQKDTPMASKNRGPKARRPAMKPEEFSNLMRAAVGVIAATHQARVGRLTHEQNLRIVAATTLDVGGAHRLIPVLAAHALTLARQVADDNDVPIEDVIAALGMHTATRT